jgi:lysyl-tRNA synthetase class 2
VAEDTADQHKVRLQKLKDMQASGLQPFAYRFERTHNSRTLLADFDKLEQSKEEIRLAGRLMTIRVMGKSIFAHVQDDPGQIQVYVKKDTVGEDAFKLFKKADMGDIFGFIGTMFRTKMGEPTVLVTKLELLAKSLRPLPEKWHGLQDKETRFRRRYLDLIANPEVRELFKKRAEIVKAVRNFLDSEGFIEVETPVLQPIYGGAAAKPFVTHHHRLGTDLYLRIADELYLKRLIVGGFEKVWEYCKDFRNEGMDRNHNPEFSMIELYWAYADYHDIMHLFQRMILHVAQQVTGGTAVTYEGNSIDLTGEWKQIALLDSITRVVGEDVAAMDEQQLRDLCRKLELESDSVHGRGKLIDKLFSEKVRPTLIQPTFIIDHPVELSPLAKPHRSQKGLTERFQPYIGGLEMGNAFSELNDPIDQKERFLRQIEAAKAGDEEAPGVLDEDYVLALEYGMPPTGGLGFGVDRLVMLFTDQHSIRDVILFPQMKPE